MKANHPTIKLIVAGGGTGGHLFPGISVAEELQCRCDADVLFVGTERGIESRVIPARGGQLQVVDVSPLKGRTPFALAKSMFKLPRSLWSARRLVESFEADLVLGVGGYAAGPVVMAAASLGIPTALLEQNAHVGLTNRLLARLVGRAYLSFEETRARFGRRARVVGNPVRAELVALADRMGSREPASPDTLLIIGGSQGSSALNEGVPAALGALSPALRQGWRVVHQAGGSEARVRARYEALGVDADVVPFIEDMASAYASAGLIVCRAGATTLAEVAAVGRASVLVPFPHAADDHQTTNARAFERAGAARLVPQSEMHALPEVLAELLPDETRRIEMARAARGLGKPHAASAVVDDLSDWLGWGLRARSAQGQGSQSNSASSKDELIETAAAADKSKASSATDEAREIEMDTKPKRRRTDLPSRPLSMFVAVQEGHPQRRRGEGASLAFAGLDASAFEGSDGDKAQLRGYGAYVPTLRQRPQAPPRRRLIGTEALAWD